MILRSLAITDFRQFRGTHRIKFAVPGRSGKKNVTVIHGPGGSGKTGIVRAMRFALLGNPCLPQDRSLLPRMPLLVNQQCMEEARSGSAKATVEIRFSSSGQTCVLRRSMLVTRQGEDWVQTPGQVRLETRDKQAARAEVTTESAFVNDFMAELGQQVLPLMPFDDLQIIEQDRTYAKVGVGEQLLPALLLAAERTQASTVSGKFAVPLITDNPFAWLSMSHRKQLLQVLPHRVSQWVLLTDYLGEAEVDVLQKSRACGQYYELRCGQNTASTVARGPLDVPGPRVPGGKRVPAQGVFDRDLEFTPEQVAGIRKFFVSWVARVAVEKLRNEHGLTQPQTEHGQDYEHSEKES